MPPLVDLGRVQVDLAGHRVLRDGEAVPLKPKAFELLAFLLRHPGQVFTRDQLLERVWGYDYAGESRTVDVHVHWLRGELEEDPASPEFLHTVRGVGYVFRAGPDGGPRPATCERMTSKSIGLPDDVHDYVARPWRPRARDPRPTARGDRQPSDGRRCRSRRAQGAMFRLLVELLGRAAARRDRHVHRLLVARGGARDASRRPARLLRHLRGVHGVARRYWAEAGVADRVDLRIGAGDRGRWTALLAEGRASTFDLAFIDADK